MNSIEILDDLFFIQRGYLSANHFVSRSRLPVLIDTGYSGSWYETRRLIEALGINLSDISLIINTHTHCDHVGGNRAIQVLSDCDIALHRVGRNFIDTRDDWATWWRYFGQQAEFFECTRSLEDGEEIYVDDHVFRIIYTPGHASDGIVLYHKKEKLLISSDTLWENDLAAMTLRVEGSTAVFQMLASLERIASLDVRQVYPGHGRPFGDCSGAITRSIKRLEGYLADRQRIGKDLLKKIIVYTLLMKQTVAVDGFFKLLMETVWYKETVDLYFGGAYQSTFDEIMGTLIHRKVVRQSNNSYLTTVPP